MHLSTLIEWQNNKKCLLLQELEIYKALQINYKTHHFSYCNQKVVGSSPLLVLIIVGKVEHIRSPIEISDFFIFIYFLKTF